MIRNVIRTIGTIVLLLGMWASIANAQYGPAEPWRDVALYRDEWGTPHIYARSLVSLGFAFGYAQAADHPETLMRAYRVANGRAAEVGGENWADSDALALMLGHAALARQTYPIADAATRDLCEGFAAGVNAYFTDNPDARTEWWTPVRPEDPLALMHCYLMSFAPFDMPDATFRKRPAFSGNAWALNPTRTEAGETMLVINPHGYYDGPFVWYEAHVASTHETDDWSMTGATLVGLPVLLMGHNGKLGWALTPHDADTADMYQPLKQDGKNNPGGSFNSPAQLISPDLLRELQIVRSTRNYRVRTASGYEDRQVIYYDSGDGPTITGPDGGYYTWVAGGYRDFGSIAQLYWMSRAASLDEFKNALELFQLPTFHVTYADAQGNIFYFYNAKVGKKRDIAGERIKGDPVPVSWHRPLPASDGNARFLWRGIMPISELPWVQNPQSGFLQACGNPPWTVSDDMDTDRSIFPNWFASETDSYRAKRVRQMLGSGTKSFRDMQDMLFDTLVPVGMTSVPRILASSNANPDWSANARPEARELVEVLRNWNYTADIRSEGMTAFQLWWNAFRRASAGQSDEALIDLLRAGDDDARAAVLDAVDEAADLMLREYGTMRVPWGDAHVISRGNERHPVGGSLTGYPIFTMADNLFDNGAWWADYGYSYAMVVSFGEYVTGRSTLTFGTSSNPKSMHFTDQLELLRGGRLKPALFYKDEVLPNAVSGRGLDYEMIARGMDASFHVKGLTPVEATIATDLRPPARTPRRLSAYSVFADYAFEGGGGEVILDAELRVTKVTRGNRPLDAFTVLAFTEDGWQPVRPQILDRENETITVSFTQPTIFALFGPQRPGGAPLEPRPTETPNPVRTTSTEPVLGNQPLNPDWPGLGARPGAIAWGREVELRPPAMDGQFRVTSSQDVGARLTTTPNPPRGLPQGFKAYTPYVFAELSVPDADVTIHIDIQPTPGAIKPDAMREVAIYACDANSKWERLRDQTFDLDPPHFFGTDTRPRIYAVLGPAPQDEAP